MRKGSHMTLEQRAKMSAAQKNRIFTDSHRKHLAESIRKSWADPAARASRSGENHYMHGKHPTAETIEKMRASRAGQNMGENNPMYGKHHGEETKHLISDAAKKRHWEPLSEEHKKKIGDANRGKKRSPESIERIEAAKKGKHTGPDNPHYGIKASSETKQKMRNAIMEKWGDPDYRTRVIAGQKKVNRSGENNSMYGKPATHSTGGWFELPDGHKIWLRSTYEMIVATTLINSGVAWSYEPKIFPLNGTGKTYCPDFYLPAYNIWWEVKGYWRPDAVEKVRLFLQQYPDEKLRIIYKEDVIMLKNFIDNGVTVDPQQIGREWDY